MGVCRKQGRHDEFQYKLTETEHVSSSEDPAVSIGEEIWGQGPKKTASPAYARRLEALFPEKYSQTHLWFHRYASIIQPKPTHPSSSQKTCDIVYNIAAKFLRAWVIREHGDSNIQMSSTGLYFSLLEPGSAGRCQKKRKCKTRRTRAWELDI